MLNARRKLNIMDNRVPYRMFGCSKHKNDRWRFVERVTKTRRLYLIRYREKSIVFKMYERGLSKEDVLKRYKWLGVIDVTEVKKHA